MRWRWILPIVGLALFVVVTVQSWRNSQRVHSARHFRWSVFLLNSQPLKTGESDVVPPLPQPSWPDSILRTTAFPAFFLGIAIIFPLSSLGLSEVLTFMTLMPLVLFTWYYWIGRLIDRRVLRRNRRAHHHHDPQPAS
jgi:hypothetical protein